ncbi:MAG: hypothetical protein ACRENJ_02820 [Candidatus Eiseniibacteriota bacterium]
MTPGARSLLDRIERSRAEFGGASESHKLGLLEPLERRSLGTAAQVLRLHEVLCFLRAYPDGPRLLAAVERMLERFPRRRDLRRHRAALADTGVAGTAIEFRFFWPTARWLARRWGSRLTVVWRDLDQRERLADLLPLLTLYGETPALDEIDHPVREWLARLKGPDETDAGFLVRRFEALPMDSFAREKVYDQLDPPLRIAPGEDTPSRTRAIHRTAPITFQAGPLDRGRPNLLSELRRPPLSVRPVARAEGQRLIDLARASMVTRSRDLDAFSWGDPDDVRLVDCGRGLQFAVIGVVPERRLMLEAVYAFLTLKNGVPIGYVLNSALYRSAEIAYNVFETWRGAEAAPIYGRVLATVRHLFGAESFTIYPYQLGEGNREALASGAWWFYQKLGFRPRDPEVESLMGEELRRMRARPSHRSGMATLARLARANLYYHLGRKRDDIIGLLPLPAVGLAISRLVADRFGSDRERGARVLEGEAARLLRVRSRRGWAAGERLAFRRWSPLVCVLPGISRWDAADRRGLVAVMRAKGGRRESEFARAFDRHRRLREAVRRLALATDAANP